MRLFEYHFYVDDDGEILCIQARYSDGENGNPWRPWSYKTLPAFIANVQSAFCYADGRIFIHTSNGVPS